MASCDEPLVTHPRCSSRAPGGGRLGALARPRKRRNTPTLAPDCSAASWARLAYQFSPRAPLIGSCAPTFQRPGHHFAQAQGWPPVPRRAIVSSLELATRGAVWGCGGEVQLRLLSSPAVLIRRMPCEGRDACISTFHLRRGTMAVESSEASGGERVQATASWSRSGHRRAR